MPDTQHINTLNNQLPLVTSNVTSNAKLINSEGSQGLNIIELAEEYLAKADGAFSKNTIKAIAHDTKQFLAWCHNENLTTTPISADTLASYVDHMAHSYATATVKRHLASISHLCRGIGLECPVKSGLVKIAIKRMERVNGTRQKQAAAIGINEIELILKTTGNRLIDLRDKAMVLTARDLLARRSELVALKVNDLIFHDDGTALLTIHNSKTDQSGTGVRMWVSEACVSALKSWLDAAAITDGNIFRAVRKGGHITDRISERSVNQRLKDMASRAGISPEQISGHSCRVGMAQDLCAAGMELTELMVAGRWVSTKMPAHYARELQASRGAVAKYYMCNSTKNAYA